MFYIIVKIIKGFSFDLVLTVNLYMIVNICMNSGWYVINLFTVILYLMYRGWSIVKEVSSLILILR